MARAAGFSTLALDEADCSPRWEDWNRRALVGLRCHTPGGTGLRGDEVNLALPHLSVARVRAQGHLATRDAAIIEREPSEAVVVYAVLRGATSFTSRQVSGRLCAGQAAVVDADLPFERSFPTAFAELALKVPRSVYAERFGTDRRPGAGATTLAGPAAVRAQVIARHLGQRVEALGSGDGESARDVQTVALDLLTDLTDRDRPGDRTALARLLVAQHLGDPSLSAPRLAAWLGVSSRQLTRLFAAQGSSLPAYLTEQRLAQASVMLRETPDRPVAEIAAACGFASASYFSRVFHESRGVSPQHQRGR